VRSKLLPRVFVFELMMAPYTVAHLKLALQLQEQGFQFGHGERLNVFLTNTLDTIKTQVDAFMANWIASENEGAENVKRGEPIEVVLGNPPYSGESRNKSDYIMELLKTYKTEPEGGALKERNGKWINDDYVKFIRFAHDRIARTGHGIVAFITNHGWLDNPTFRGMRARLMEDFDDIYVLDLHGNSKKQERTPSALGAFGDDKNVFDIEQGVGITFLVKLPAHKNTSLDEENEFELVAQEYETTKLPGGKVTLRARIHHSELWGSRDHKYGWLESHSIADTHWQIVQPPLPQLLLTPRDESTTAEYERGWKITDIMPIHSVGIVTARDGLTIHFTSNQVKATIQRFANLPVEAARSEFRLGPDAQDWTVETAQRDLIESGLDPARIAPIAYRPFDTRFTYYTGNSKGFHCRARGDVTQHLLPPSSSVALSTTRSLETGAFTHVFVSNSIACHHAVSSKEVNYVFPELLLSDASAIVEPRQNLSAHFLRELNMCGANHVDSDSRRGWFSYIYAILHAPSYRSRYAEFLKSDFPRIPIALHPDAPKETTFANVWEKLLPLGHELIDLHLLRKVPVELRANFPQAGTSEVEKPRYDPPNTPTNPTTTGRVYINATQFFDGVPPETWAFKVGGYQVCEKWLKDRKGRTLTSDDVDHYRNVVAALTRTRVLMRDIDGVVNGVIWPRTDSAG
jgi:predicted helicase